MADVEEGEEAFDAALAKLTEEERSLITRKMIALTIPEESPIMVILEWIAFHVWAGNILKIWMIPSKKVSDKMTEWYEKAQEDFKNSLLDLYADAVGEMAKQRLMKAFEALKADKLFEKFRKTKPDYFK